MVDVTNLLATQISLKGRKQDILLLRKQNRDPTKRKQVEFRLPAGGQIGEDIKAFFALAEGEEERYRMPVSELTFFPFLFLCFIQGVWSEIGVCDA